MATQTTNLGLTKPGYDEAADVVPAVNNNMDTLDSKIGAVPANSSVQGQLDSHTQAIGNLSNLTTTEKGSLVGAANELNSKIGSTHYNLSDVATIGSGTNVTGDVFKAGNVVSLYIHGSGLAIAQVLGVLKSGFHPNTAYIIMPVFDSSSPYNPVVGSIWIHSNGRIEKYGSSGGEYAYGTFVVDE